MVGRFLSPDPYIQNPSFSQSYNRYSYCLNNPLKFTDYSREKWKWNYLNPFYHFQNFMQWVNDKTPQLRQNMVNAGVPNFGVNYNTTFGTGFSVGDNPAYYPFYENKILHGQQGISNQIAGFSGRGADTGSPRFGNGDVINQQYETGYAFTGGISTGQRGSLGTNLGYVNDGFNAVGIVTGSGELFTQANAGLRITYTTFNGASSWVSSAKVISTFKAVGTYTLVGSGVVDLTLGVTGYQTPNKTIANMTVGIGAWAIGGIPGIAVGVGYTILDKTGCLNGPSVLINYTAPNIPMQDATRVVLPPVINPQVKY
jgi:hypothetical protein